MKRKYKMGRQEDRRGKNTEVLPILPVIYGTLSGKISAEGKKFTSKFPTEGILFLLKLTFNYYQKLSFTLFCTTNIFMHPCSLLNIIFVE